MQLTIEGHQHTFIPIQIFRAQWNLSDDFSLACFEPKDWQGLGTLTGAGNALTKMKQHVVEAVPPRITFSDLLTQIMELSQVFRGELEVINPEIGLRDVEVDFAVAGFQDVMQSVGYHLIQLRQVNRDHPAQIWEKFDFSMIYQAWLDDSTRVSTTTHVYTNQVNQFKIRVIYNAYGRVGLEVSVAGQIYYVTDMILACPASNYMENLCKEVALAVCQAFLSAYPSNED